eukprot:scaffold6447_cov278-Chaetoceros_neogracile.AAC.4
MTQRKILPLLTLCSFTSQFTFAFVPSLLHFQHFPTTDHGSAIHLSSQPQDSQNQSSSASKSKPKAKYVLGENITGGLLEEESGLYWNTLFDYANTKVEEKDNSTDNKRSTELDDADPSFNLTGAYALGLGKNTPIEYVVETKENDEKQLRVKNTEGKRLSRALWFYGQGDGNKTESESSTDSYLSSNDIPSETHTMRKQVIPSSQQELRYEDIDQSIPLSVYCPDRGIDLVWDLLRQEAKTEAEREPILVSFLYSNILNHPSLESALAFHLATRLASPSMDSIQIMNIILDAMDESKDFSRSMRADIMAVRDRDPACTCLPDVFLHFKGFHALQSYRVAHHLWNENKKTLAHYMQSQMSQNFQIDIHPKATLLSGIMLDHGTGIVIGETARVGYNCSILHHVTLGGSGKRGVERHPKVGNGVLLGAGSTILGNIVIGGGSQVGAGTLVIEDLPPNSVAVGVPAKIIGSYKAKVQPSQNMDQVGSEASDKHLSTFSMDGI